MIDRKRALIAASVAGLLAAVTTAGISQEAQAAKDGKEPCYGINKCKGTGDCGGKGYSCAGKNGCKGAGWIYLDPEDCTRIDGGSLTPAE